MTFDEITEDLMPFETFDPAVFTDSDTEVQQLCDFVLSLALAFNDFRTVALAHQLLNELHKSPDNPPTPKIALRNSLRNTVFRMQTGFIHELLKLIRNHKMIVDSSSFKSLMRKMSRDGRASWSSLVAVATDKPANGSLAKSLVILRNTVVFHYDPSQIKRGFRSAFLNPSPFGKPLLSRGDSLAQTCFYFADAATQANLFDKSRGPALDDFIHGRDPIYDNITLALHEIVTRFINSRVAWQPYMAGT